MSQIRPPEDQMPGRGIGYRIALLGLLAAVILFGLIYLITVIF